MLRKNSNNKETTMVAKTKNKAVKKKTTKKTMRKAKEVTQKLELKASITDEKGNVSEFTKPFGDNIVVMENMCNVGLSVGETINTGNYNNRKFQVSLHVPCHTSEMGGIFKAITKKVNAWAEEIKSEIESEI